MKGRPAGVTDPKFAIPLRAGASRPSGLRRRAACSPRPRDYERQVI